MDILVVSGTIRCQLCHQALMVSRSFVTQLRIMMCVNPLCPSFAYRRELSLYTQVPGQPTSHGTTERASLSPRFRPAPPAGHAPGQSSSVEVTAAETPSLWQRFIRRLDWRVW